MSNSFNMQKPQKPFNLEVFCLFRKITNRQQNQLTTEVVELNVYVNFAMPLLNYKKDQS